MAVETKFKRVLSRRDLILYGLVILTPTAPYPLYGIVQQVSHGHAALSYIVAMVGMLFTGNSYAKMSAAYPSAGSTYTYAQRALNEHVGFLAGWAMILDYFLIPLLSVIYAALTAQRMLPYIPYFAWAVIFTSASRQ
jgi:putrescine importer